MSQQPADKSQFAQGSTLRLTLPLPPSLNEQYATVNGHRVSSQNARRFKQQVQETLRSLARQGTRHDELRNHFHQGYLALFLDFCLTTTLKRDLDARLEITLDARCKR